MRKPTSGFELIPLSARATLSFLEHARVEVHGGAVVYRKDENGRFWDYNIPYVNTSIVHLGEGTSITRDAARMLADHGTLIAFVGGGGMPLVSAMEPCFLPLTPQDEYRPTQYMQAWARIFADEPRRLATAKRMLLHRLKLTGILWKALSQASDYGLSLDGGRLRGTAGAFTGAIGNAKNTTELLTAEGRFAKSVYAEAAKLYSIDGFTRTPGADTKTSDGNETPNRLLDHLNYIAYGAAAVVLHGLGISYAMPLLHGKTRRGALVFDVADLIKDGLCLPIAFWGAATAQRDQACRTVVTEAIHDLKVLLMLFDWVKEVCDQC